MDISVILPVVNEYDNLRILIPRIQASLDRETLSYEIISQEVIEHLPYHEVIFEEIAGC